MSDHYVYILLTDTGTLFTKAIRLYTKKPYNHASIAFDEELMEVFSFGRKHSRNPFIGGFVREKVGEGLFKHATCEIYRLAVSKTELKKMKEYIKQIEEQQGKYKYNLLGLFAIILDMQLTRRNAFFCSEFVASVLLKSSKVAYSLPASLVTPSELVRNFELVYKGKLLEYKKENIKVTSYSLRENCRRQSLPII